MMAQMGSGGSQEDMMMQMMVVQAKMEDKIFEKIGIEAEQLVKAKNAAQNK